MLTIFLWPIAMIVARIRLCSKKEDPTRVRERFGYASLPPLGSPLWFHAASVGEVISLMPLIETIPSDIPILLTTQTLTGFETSLKILGERCSHQFIPYDVPIFWKRFLNHWNPRIALFVESEIWPSGLSAIKKHKIPIWIINGRLSLKSYHGWKKIPLLSESVFSKIDRIYVPHSDVKQRFEDLGALNVRLFPNLKLFAPPLSRPQFDFKIDRLNWIAASTHPGEEDIFVSVHQKLQEKYPETLLILIPRHPKRSEDLRNSFSSKGFVVDLYTEGFSPKTEILIVNVLGGMGTFFSLKTFVCIGGSFMPIGGHNPLEPLRLGNVVSWGPFMQNFEDIISFWEDDVIVSSTPEELLRNILSFFKDPSAYQKKTLRVMSRITQEGSKLDALAQEILHP